MTPTDVTNALKNVLDPERHRDLVSLGMVNDISVSGSNVSFTLVTTIAAALREKLEADAVAAVEAIGATDVSVTFAAPAAAKKPAQSSTANPLPQIKHVIAVGAGKGGVGKSTMSVNLAIALQRTGHRVGLMDGDIYGPSMPTMLGINGAVPGLTTHNGARMIVPMFLHGLHVISIGALVEPEKPLIWRGPMAHGAFKQLLLDNTLWPELDYLIVDLPPGTGDVPLSLCQTLPLAGAVVVATPQQVALDDAIRAVAMFKQLETPVLGMLENMSFFVDDAGREHDIFGRGGVEIAARRLKVPYLGNVPMFTSLRQNSDSGTPLANFEGNALLRQSLEHCAAALVAEVSRRASMRLPVLEIS